MATPCHPSLQRHAQRPPRGFPESSERPPESFQMLPRDLSERSPRDSTDRIPDFSQDATAIPVCRFGGILKFFIGFNHFSLVFNGFDWFKWLFEPIRLELDQVSAQMVDPRPESWHFWKLAYGLLGWGTTLRERKVPSGIAPQKTKIKPQTAAWHHSTAWIPQAAFHTQDSTARIPQPRFHRQDSTCRIAKPAFHRQNSTTKISQA